MTRLSALRKRFQRNPRTSGVTGSASGSHRRSLQYEALEDRRLLSVSRGPELALPAFQHDPDRFAADQILVRFQDSSVGHEGVGRTRLAANANLWRVQVDAEVGIAAALAQFRARGDVLYAEPDYLLRLQTSSWDGSTSPNDAIYTCSMLWGLHNNGTYEGTADRDIDAELAWPTARGSSVVVAVVDTGVDYNHPDLKANMWRNPGEVGGVPGFDDDGNGYVDDVYGWDFANNDSDPMDDHSHGTHVAGTIAAIANNDTGGCSSNTARGVLGVAPEAQIMALKFFDASGNATTSNAILALNYAVSKGAQISNHSYGDTVFSNAMLDAVSKATANNNHLFVAAAGNGNWLGIGQNNDTTPFYPASYTPVSTGGMPAVDAVISVAATDSNDTFASFSNYGATSVDLSAPGVNIWSTHPLALDASPVDGYSSKNGTSMAAPHVAGAAALAWSAKPGLNAMGVKNLLLASVDPLPSTTKATVTRGRLNAGNALSPSQLGDPAPQVVLAWEDGTVVSGNIATLTARAKDNTVVSQVEFKSQALATGVTTSLGLATANGDGTWTLAWDTSGLADGRYVVTAVASDDVGQTGSDRATALINNVAPAISLTNPTAGQTLQGTTLMTATASSDTVQVEFLANGQRIGLDNLASDNWSISWNTANVTNGIYSLTAVARDREGSALTSAAVSVTVENAVITVIASDGFESGNYSGGKGWKGNWTVAGDTALRTDAGPTEGRYHARLRRSTGDLIREVDLGGTSWTDVSLSFSYKSADFESNDKGYVWYRTSASAAWQPVETILKKSSYTRSTKSLSTAAISTLFIRFDAGMDSTGDNWYLDAIEVSGRKGSSPAPAGTTSLALASPERPSASATAETSATGGSRTLAALPVAAANRTLSYTAPLTANHVDLALGHEESRWLRSTESEWRSLDDLLAPWDKEARSR